MLACRKGLSSHLSAKAKLIGTSEIVTAKQYHQSHSEQRQ
jgi:hypothetical protein